MPAVRALERVARARVAVVRGLDPVGPAPEAVVGLELVVLALVLVRVVVGPVLAAAVVAEALRAVAAGRRIGGAGLPAGVRVARAVRRTGIGMRVRPRTGVGLSVLGVMTSLRGIRSVGRCPARVGGTIALAGIGVMIGAVRGAGLVRDAA